METYHSLYWSDRAWAKQTYVHNAHVLSRTWIVAELEKVCEHPVVSAKNKHVNKIMWRASKKIRIHGEAFDRFNSF